MYIIMKRMCPAGYLHNGSVAYSHIASVRFENSLCHGSLMTTYLYYILYYFTYYSST